MSLKKTNMKALYISITLFLFSYTTIAQQIIFAGVVQDSTGTKLASASLVAANAKTKAFQGYSITDEKGQFELGFKKNETYVVKITYMGYHSVVDTVQTIDADIFKTYTLKPDLNQLEGVELKYEMPVQIKGDTIVYNADSFTTGNEKKLGDVMKKMPGIEVAKDGTVKVEGKEVKKVMVEGKDFFDGDSKLATKNIPAKAVKKVEVLRNYNENSQMKGFEDNEESYAINIRLKKGQKKFWFGEVTSGVGNEEKYLFHPKLFYYSPKKTYNIILDFNNIGSPPLTWQEMFKLTGGFSSRMRKSGAGLNFSSSDLGFSVLQNDRANYQKNEFGAFNYNITASPHLNLKGFLIGNFAKTEMLTETDRIYTANHITEQIINSDKLHNKAGVAKFDLNYDPDENFNIKYGVMGKISNVSENELNASSVTGNTFQKKEEDATNISQNFELYKTLKSENLISLEVQHEYNKNIPLTEAISSNEFFASSSLIDLSPQNTYDLLQHKKLSGNKISTLVDYYLILNDVSHLDFSLGNQYIVQNFTSSIAQKMDNGTENVLSSSMLKNDAYYRFLDSYGGLHYKLLWKNFIFRPSLNLHYYDLNDKQFGDTKKQNQWALLPAMSIKYSLKRGTRLYFKYKLTNTFSDITKYARGYVLSSFNRLKGGNRDLDNVYKNQFTLRYSSYSFSKFRFLHASLSYTKAMNSIRNQSVLLQTDIVSLPVNINHPDESLMANMSYSKRYISWNYRLYTSLSKNKYYSIVNNVETLSTSLSQNYNLSLSSNFAGFFNFDMGYQLHLNDFETSYKNSTYTTHNPNVVLEFSLFKNAVLLKTKYDYYNYRDQSHTINNYAFLSADLYYQKEGSKWEFVLSGQNLLQTNSLNSESLNELMIATSRYYVQPQYFMFKINYKL